MFSDFSVFCFILARLPFKRLNPVPKEAGQTKRTRTATSAPPSCEPCASDGENEADSTSAPLQPRPALINGRGPLDGFMRRTKCPSDSSNSSVVIDLTEDSNSTGVKTQSSALVDAFCPPAGEAAKNTQNVTVTKEPEAASAVPLLSEETMETDDAEDSVALSQLDTTLESETETDQKQQQETEESQENESLLSTSSVSLIESSPEPSKRTPTTPASVSRQRMDNAKTRTLQIQMNRKAYLLINITHLYYVVYVYTRFFPCTLT